MPSTNQTPTTQSGSLARSRSTDDMIDTTPLLPTTVTEGDTNTSTTTTIRPSLRRHSLRDATWFLRRARSRRMMREPSMVVREAAAEQLEERQSDWAYSKPVVILDFIWNLAFVAVSVAMMVLSREENPTVPLRPWIVGYVAQCCLHMACVCAEYGRRRRMRRRRRRLGLGLGFGSGRGGGESDGDLSSGSRGESAEYVSLAQLEEESTRYGY